MIHGEFRNTIWSDKSQVREFKPGATISEIVAAFDKPIEFETHGGVYLKRGENDKGHVVERENWHRVRPKDGTALFISLVPKGGDGKDIFTVVAAIALVALTIWIGGGGLAVLAPSLFSSATFGAGTTGALVAAAAVSVAGSVGLQLLTKPPAGSSAPGASAQQSVSGISQNPIAAYAQVPGVLAEAIRISPPLLARPFTLLENGELVLYAIAGTCGPCAATDVKINETDVADLASGAVSYETRLGWPDDPALTLVTQSGFEENINVEMSTHRLESDQKRLIKPYSGSYPRPHVFRSARNADRFRIRMNFPAGVGYYDDDDPVTIAYRIRVRRVGTASWTKLPEIHLNAFRRSAFRQEIWFHWGDASVEAALSDGSTAASALFKRSYFKNPEWTAASYFDEGASGTVVSSFKHVYPYADGIKFFFDEATFAKGRYDIEITRGFADDAGSFDETTYEEGLFTYRTLSAGVQSIPDQNELAQTCAIESYTTFRDEYPIVEHGLALMAFKVRNMQVNSLSAVFGSIINIWNGSHWNSTQVSGNPGALARHVLTGSLNARPIPVNQIDNTLADLYEHAVDKGLVCNHVVTQGSVEQAASIVAMVGDAILRRSDKWGVVIDRDRSDEPLVGMFHPGNMTGPMKVTKVFITGARAIVPHFIDEDRDYAERDLDYPVIDDDVPSAPDMLTESAPYEGYTSEALVIRRATLDLRRARLRTLRYDFETSLTHLKNKKGNVSGLAHDILANTFGTGRVSSFTVVGGNLKSVTLNTAVSDMPVASYDALFEVERVMTLAEFFALGGAKIGLQIELPDASVVVFPISGVEGCTLTIEGSVTAPSGLKKTCLAAVGLRDRVTRRIIITDISPKDDLFASVQAIDLAPQIFAGM